MPRASVIVPTFNGDPLLPRVLTALMDQDYDGDYEVLVVDDGSEDDTPRVLEEWMGRYPERLRAFRQENAGPARARNRGAWEARGRILAFIDDDCIAERSWLRSLDAALDRAGTSAVAGMVMNPAETWVGRYINRESVIGHVLAADGSVAELITGNAGIWTNVFREVRGFDEAIRVAGGEDTELSLRLRAAGHRIAWAPDARVFHESRVGVAGYLRMIYRHGRGRHRLGERFPSYRMRFARLRLMWLTWPLRAWAASDYLRYRRDGVARGEAVRYVLLRYLENIARVAGYIRDT